MPLSSLAAPEVDPALVSSILAVVKPVSSRFAIASTSSSTTAPSVQFTTVTILEVIYLAPATSEASPTAAKGSVAAPDASNLASIATDSYDGLSFVQLGAAFSTVFVVVLVISCFAAFFLRQAGQMRRLMEVTDEEELSDVGLGDGGTRAGERASRGGTRGERRGLIPTRGRARSDRRDLTSDSSDGDEDVKL